MKTDIELNENIVKKTMRIRNEFPKLVHFLSEIPITIPNLCNPEISNKILQDYYDSLQNLHQKHTSNHKVLSTNFKN